MTLALFGVRAQAQRSGQSTVVALDLAMVLMVSAFLGGRLFHVLYEAPNYYWQYPVEIFKFWRGGFVYYGGLLLALAALAFKAHRQRLDFWRWADFFAPFFAGTYALGRWGCFFNGCCYGRTSTAPWAVEFSAHAHWGLTVVPRHPTQIYASIGEFLILALLLGLASKWRKAISGGKSGKIFLVWLGLHGLNRIIMESFRDDDRGSAIFHLSIGVWISLILISVSLLSLILRRRPLSKL